MSERVTSEFDTLNELVRAAEGAERESSRAERETGWLPEPPGLAVFGNQTVPQEDAAAGEPQPVGLPESVSNQELAEQVGLGDWSPQSGSTQGAGYQQCQCLVNRAYQKEPPDPVDVVRVLTQSGQLHLGPVAAPGRKNVLDTFMRGRLVSLLGMGLSLRQAGAALSISHVAIVKALQRDADLREEVSKARYQAQIEPLSKIIRESRHNWKAATWLVNYFSKHELPREVTSEQEHESQEQDPLA